MRYNQSMDRTTAELLCEITQGFYATYADEFSATRQGPWAGWNRCLDEMGLGVQATFPARRLGTNEAAPLTVLDLGCGNLRFLRYVREQLPPELQLEGFAVDNCKELLPSEETLAHEYPFLRFQKLDIMQRIIHEASLAQAIEAPRCHVVACFGLMHHMPGLQYRARLLAEIMKCVQSDGYAVVSFWHFMDSLDLARQAEETHQQALVQLSLSPEVFDKGDYLLGWQGKMGAYRYCHHFTDIEIDELVESLGNSATLKARFKSDGRTGALNTYLILQAR